MADQGTGVNEQPTTCATAIELDDCSNLEVQRVKSEPFCMISMTSNGGARLSALVAAAVLCVLVSMVSLSARLLAADGRQAIDSIAMILLDFTHVPSVSQKATLQAILDQNTATVAEQVLAQALINVEHIASPDDKPKLEALIRDESAPPAVKTLATILSNLTHTPTDVDKKKLRQLLRRVCASSRSKTPSVSSARCGTLQWP